MSRMHKGASCGIRIFLPTAMAVFGLLGSPVQSQVSRTQVAPLQVDGDRFLLRGKPFQIISGELEYARIPRAEWRDRVRKVMQWD